MPKMPSLPIAVPSVGDDELEALAEVIESGWLTQGAKVAAFEAAFAALHHVNHAVAVTSCTTGLHLALHSLGIGPGDEVIVPAFTWISTANVVLHCGSTPVFADISPKTFNIDVASVSEKITANTRAIIPVHLFGLCADMDALCDVLPDHVIVLEDAACAAGAEYKGRRAGSLGNAGVFSFHPRKAITTGEGGMITTNDDLLAAELRRLRNHGASVSEEERHLGPKPHILPEFPVVGFNYRMTDLQGAVGMVQTSKLEALVNERARLASIYRDMLGGLEWLHLPEEPADGRHAWQSFVGLLSADAPVDQETFLEGLQKNGISGRPGTHAVPLQKIYQKMYGYTASDFPGAVVAATRSVALPLHNKMNDADVERVARSVRAMPSGAFDAAS